jgi:hypothetical protein
MPGINGRSRRLQVSLVWLAAALGTRGLAAVRVPTQCAVYPEALIWQHHSDPARPASEKESV